MMQDLNVMWMLFCILLVFFMQIGFALQETGMCRSKNNISVVSKNIIDVSIATFCFWLIGFTLMYGDSVSGWIGRGFSSVSDYSKENGIALLFNAMYCATSITIVSGVIAERLKFKAYVLLSVVAGGLIFPVFGHWAWNKGSDELAGGWLYEMGYFDFAGGSVVHMLGATIGLVLSILLKPRKSRFTQKKVTFSSNLPLVSVGVLFLWLGWYGFNAGSYFAWDKNVSVIYFNTTFSAVTGMLTGLAWELFKCKKHVKLEKLITGLLAGLVSVTPACHVLTPNQTIAMAIAGALFAFLIEILLYRLKIDDAVNGVAVHLGAGLIGILGLALVVDSSHLTLSRLDQFFVQLVGALACIVWAGGITFIFYVVFNPLYQLRVKEEDEIKGLNFSEHGELNALQEMGEIMVRQKGEKEELLRVPEDPYTDTGQIARKYNDLITHLEEQALQTEKILGTTSDGILAFYQNEKNIFRSNDAAEQIFGYDHDSIFIKSVYDLMMKDGEFITHHTLNEIRRDGLTELTGVRKDGSKFPLQIDVSRGITQGKFLYVIVCSDISDRKQKQQELEHALNQSEESLKAKDNFLAMVNHELRTPLNGIIGNAEILKKELNEGQVRKVDRILNESHYLLLLINDILDRLAISKKELTIKNEAFDLHAMLDQLRSNLELMAAKKQLSFILNSVFKSETWVQSDQLRLTQVLSNLCVNGLKYTEEGSVELRVAYELMNEQTMLVKFDVIDTGVGIKEQDFEKVFESFSKIDGDTSGEGGIGLGAAICKTLVKRMGGDIVFESEYGKGSIFSVVLPLKMIQAPKKKVISHVVDVNNISGKVLLVEDTITNREIISEWVSGTSVELTTAGRAEKGLELLKEHDYDLILMDYRMPGMNGVDATKVIREELKVECPVVGFTANRHLIKNEDHVFDEILDKPLNEGRFYASLEKWLVDYQKIIKLVDKELIQIQNQKLFVPEKLNYFLQVFFEESEELHEEILKNYEDEDLQKLSRNLHSLRGSAGNYRMEYIIELATEYEEKCLEGLSKFELDTLQMRYVHFYTLWVRVWKNKLKELGHVK